MARFLDDDLPTPPGRPAGPPVEPLDRVRTASGAQRNAQTEAWLSAGDTLAEKAVAALDTGDDARAAQLVQRIIALPVVDDSTRSGLLAVELVLLHDVLDPDEQADAAQGLLELPLRLLPTLEEPVADELRHVLAVLTDFELPAAVVRRIRAVVPLERRFDAPFAGVPEEALPRVVTGTLRLVLRLRSDGL